MKTVSIIAMLVILLEHSLQAQIPRTIGFQGVLTDAQGNLIPDGNHTLTLKLYDNVAAPTPIFTESQTVPVVKGVFNVIIGSVTALPASLLFDRAYFLGVTVDGGLELAPRTALTAVPYALRADRANIAEALTPNATGVVTSINNQSGALTMQGGGGTTVTNVGNTFTISSVGGGGTGIQGVQSTDGSLAIQNPNGPVANLSVASNAITKDKIATGQVVKSINNLKDDVTLSAGSNVTITPNGNTLTISSSDGSGGVTSVNNVTGAVTLAASGGATINTAGNTITINAGSGGTGILGVQNTDNTLDITNPNGPTATINVKGQGITSVQLADNAVTALKIADGTITSSKLAPGVIPSTLPPSGAAGGDLSGTYPNPTIAANAITNAKIADGTIAASDLADNSVTSAKIVDGTIAASDLADNSVTSAKIVDGTIATADLADASVTTGKINSTGAMSGQVLSYNGSNVVWSNLPSGGGTLDQAYDFGGAGSGRTITADAGAVLISGTDGLISTGNYGTGADISVSGPGTRLIWYPKKAAFRAGYATLNHWDDANIGLNSAALGGGGKASGASSITLGGGCTASGNVSVAIGNTSEASGIYSTAIGQNCIASNQNSLAMGNQSTASGSGSVAIGYDANATSSSYAIGHQTTASGPYSVALGQSTTASGQSSTTTGYNTTASGMYSTAMGRNTTASGNYSTAIGSYVSTNSNPGAFIIGDFSTTTVTTASGANRFTARFDAGYRLYTKSDLSTGVSAYNGANSWSSISDSTLKIDYLESDAERLLKNFSSMRLGSWRYKSQDNSYRHYGPMAQEWFSAFGHDGVGTIGNDTTLATADVDGVLCIAIQALEKRTSEQKEIITTQETILKAIIAKQEVELNDLRERLRRLETRFANDGAQSSASTVTSHARSSE